jgi:hypothetical protein
VDPPCRLHQPPSTATFRPAIIRDRSAARKGDAAGEVSRLNADLAALVLKDPVSSPL